MGLLSNLKSYIRANTPRATSPRVSPAKVINEGLLNPNKFNAPQANRLKDSALGLLGIVPGVGDVAAGVEAADLWNRGEKLGAGLSALGTLPLIPALGAHIVYHGSPHKFDKFDISKIGTGEGAQAYGHGLYFAENPKVAQSYKEALSDPIPVINGRQRNFDDNDEFAASVLLQSKNNADAAVAFLKTQLQKVKKGSQSESKLIDTINIISSGKQLPKADYSGNLYKVDIPDEIIPRMLDWDAPLSKQPEGVRVAVQDLGLPANATGKDAYNALANLARDGAIARGNNAATTLGGSQSAASVDLQGYGIPGIRYLDGNSRGTGGTSNFVLFDDQLPRILEVNGQPTGLLSWAEEAKRKK